MKQINKVYDAKPNELIRRYNTYEELLAVAKGCLGYLTALPESGTCRPDAAWLKPLIAAIAKAEKV